ncbi:polysaccharide deacetylase [Xylanimonas cellulosilytica DSM 15894]|uniref:Polysaccharide deacetylase n=1 Tax=Xylanimonas cellulosilytica (strain DSM 15894 / JCM 12276 / CECT 5975 / KCTC 9989 / LMG 20990 / NBRC 107835 / XIL07) TaxID=446471 RepID=D1BVJ6_XYLCX|nr:polysaccharide deacetylase family protein [Xylanimonas cellulosilytica]ACZ31315.1 polysaccharide deacetylase [Xylanimonas cellulosilytica DSM 15894]
MRDSPRVLPRPQQSATDAGRVRTRLVRRLGVALAATLVVALGAPLALNAVAADRPVLGVTVDGVSRRDAWTDVDAAAATLAAERATATLTVTAGGLSDTRTLADLGLVDSTDAVRVALLDASRGGTFWQDAVDQTRALWRGARVAAPPDTFDPDGLAAAVDAIAAQVATPPVDAAIDPAGGQVTVRPEVPGTRLDTVAAQRAILDAVEDDRGAVDLPTTPVPAAITTDDLEPVAATLRAAVARPLELVAGGTRRTIAPERVLAALPVMVDDDGPRVGVDAVALDADLDALAAEVDVDARLRIVMSGTVVAPGADGRRLDRTAADKAVLAELRARAAGQGADAVEIPVTTLPTRVQEATPGAFDDPRTVHLTFDDGPGAHTEKILDILADRGVHATFYVIGERAQRYPDTVRRILAEGHRLGNHSLTHADLTTLTPEQVAAELATTQEILTEITGVRPTAFRPPFGAVDDVVRAVAEAESLSIDLWDVDPEDWRGPGAAVVRDRVLDAARPGSVVLLHVLRQGTVDALPQIIDRLRADGLELD